MIHRRALSLTTSLLLCLATAPPAHAQEDRTGPSAAAAIESILSGRDDEAAWSALETALGAEGSGQGAGVGVPGVGHGVEGPDPGGRLDDRAPGGTLREVVDAAPSAGLAGATEARAGTILARLTEVVPTRVLAGIVAGLLAGLLLLGGYLLARVLGRAFRALGRRRARRGGLVRRSRRPPTACRDAARLEAQLRARRAA